MVVNAGDSVLKEVPTDKRYTPHGGSAATALPAVKKQKIVSTETTIDSFFILFSFQKLG
jgi:hypothetical protein